MQATTRYLVFDETGKVIHSGQSLRLALRIIRAALAFGIIAHIHTWEVPNA